MFGLRTCFKFKSKFKCSCRISWPTKFVVRNEMTFSLDRNSMTGMMEWVPQNDGYDYQQEIARSGYADMLHDEERNELYYKAIRKSVGHIVRQLDGKRPIRIVDIGTGTGLLSMMAVRSAEELGAKAVVTAFECFEPMANCAQKVIARNGFEESITVVKMRSTDSMPLPEEEKGDLLITELFDTELIGEGAIGSYNHALKSLVTRNALAVPAKSRVWVQLVTAEKIHNWNQFGDISTVQINSGDIKVTVKPPANTAGCYGSGILHDVQLSQLKPGIDFDVVSEPQVAFEFNFTDTTSMKQLDKKVLEFVATRAVKDERLAVLFWWDLWMDWDESILLSCAPYWAHPSGQKLSDLPWREHWIQAIYHLPANSSTYDLDAGDNLSIVAFHDEYTFSFSDQKDNDDHCSCRLHQHFSRTRLGLLNDSSRYQPYIDVTEELTANCSRPVNILFLGDPSNLPVMLEKSLCDKVNEIYCVASKTYSKEYYVTLLQANNAKKIRLIEHMNELPADFDCNLVVGEPYFGHIDLPWDLLHFWYLAAKVKKQGVLSNLNIVPSRVVVKSVAVQFDHLHKIRAKVHETQGFDLTDFDNLIQDAMAESDETIESQPLWEYPGKAVSSEETILFDWTFDQFEKLISSKDTFVENDITFNLCPNALNLNLKNYSLVFWIEFSALDSVICNTGPIKDITIDHYINWTKNWKQGVAFFFEDMAGIKKQTNHCIERQFKAKFNLKAGSLTIKAI